MCNLGEQMIKKKRKTKPPPPPKSPPKQTQHFFEKCMAFVYLKHAMFLGKYVAASVLITKYAGKKCVCVFYGWQGDSLLFCVLFF